MKFHISNLTYLSAENVVPQVDGRYCFARDELPKLEWVPKMQRRRLSAFNKMALHCMYTASNQNHALPIVFSSRHGDLNKTSLLLDAIANEEELSPTSFSMSVHNASVGLYSIFTGNQSAYNSISAGANSFRMAICDAYARLQLRPREKVLVVHCDEALSASYHQFNDELQVDHCVAFLMQTPASQATNVSVSLSRNTQRDPIEEKPQALRFVDRLLRDKHESPSSLCSADAQWIVEVVE